MRVTGSSSVRRVVASEWEAVRALRLEAVNERFTGTIGPEIVMARAVRSADVRG